MALTVESALSLEVFSRVPLKLYAGGENLQRSVRWVHPVEIPDIAHFLKGGEMLLTAGLGIAHDEKAQRAHVRALAEAGASVLVIELSGRAYRTMPEALVDEAARLGFPLVGLDGELPFVEVSAQVHGSLLDQRMQELTAYERLNETFMRMLLDGRDHVAFTQALADEISRPVILEDSSRRIVAYSSGTEVSDAEVSGWDLHSRVLHSGDTLGGTSAAPAPLSPLDGKDGAGETGTGMACTRRAIVIRGERWGWLHVIHAGDGLLRTDQHAIDRTADVIAISVLSAREVGAPGRPAGERPGQPASAGRHLRRILHHPRTADGQGSAGPSAARRLRGQGRHGRPSRPGASGRCLPGGDAAGRGRRHR